MQHIAENLCLVSFVDFDAISNYSNLLKYFIRIVKEREIPECSHPHMV